MTWNASNIRWRLQFKSLTGTGCLVNIYSRGWQSNADGSKTGADVPFAVETNVTELTGGARPFVYDEDETDNLLQVVRYKTGYLRLIETSIGQLDGIMPYSIQQGYLSRYVEVWYGNKLVFTGYLKNAEYTNQFVAPPYEREFVVTSPLGVLEHFNFSIPSSPEDVTVGAVMKEVIDGLNCRYNKVIYPRTDEHPWDCLMNSTVYCPYNSQFTHKSPADELFAPKDFLFFIEGIASCYGWIVHDKPDAIIFTKYNRDEDYSYIEVADLPTAANRRTFIRNDASITAWFKNADNNATLSCVQPLKQIDVTFEGEKAQSVEMTTDHCRTYSGSLGSGSDIYTLTQVGDEVDGEGIGTAVVGGGTILVTGLFPVAVATWQSGETSCSYDDYWVTCYSSSWGVGTKLISWKRYGTMDSTGGLGIRLQIAVGTSLGNLKTSGWSNNIPMRLRIKGSNGKYFNLDNSSWVDYVKLNDITFDKHNGFVVPNYTLADGFTDANGIIIYNNAPIYNGTVEIALYTAPSMGLANASFIKYVQIGFFNPSEGKVPYEGVYDPQEYVLTNPLGVGIGEDSFSVGLNSRFYGSRTFVNANNRLTSDKPDLSYMFKIQTWVNQRFLPRLSVNYHTGEEYINSFSYWKSGWRWRILAMGHDLRNGEFSLTLVNTSDLND